jgi:hypothetical protein
MTFEFSKWIYFLRNHVYLVSCLASYFVAMVSHSSGILLKLRENL